MAILAKSVSTEITYYASFDEPRFDLVLENRREALFRNIFQSFKIRLNEIKFNHDAPSNNYIHFSKFFGETFFDVSYGLEEVTSIIRKPDNAKEVFDLNSALFSSFQGQNLALQRLLIQQHFLVESGLQTLFHRLNPYTPPTFSETVTGKGVNYTLQTNSDQTVYIFIAPSLFVKDGLFLSLEHLFKPGHYDFDTVFNCVHKMYLSLLKEIDITE